MSENNKKKIEAEVDLGIQKLFLPLAGPSRLMFSSKRNFYCAENVGGECCH